MNPGKLKTALQAAGFTDGKTCCGRSETLKLESRPQDTTLLNGNQTQAKTNELPN